MDESDDEYSSDSQESLISVTVTLDFDPVEFQGLVEKMITTYDTCADTYLEWKFLPERLCEKLHSKLDKSMLNFERERPLTPWLKEEVEKFMEEARMKIMISAFDQFTIENPRWVKDPKVSWIRDRNLRMDMRILAFKLRAVIAQLSAWDKLDVRSQPSDPEVNLDKAPIEQKSVVTFMFTTLSTEGKPRYQSLQLMPSRSEQKVTHGRVQGREKKSSTEKRLDVNLNPEVSPSVSLSGSNAWDFVKEFKENEQQTENTERDLSTVDIFTDDFDDTAALHYVSSSHSHFDDEFESIRCETQIYSYEGQPKKTPPPKPPRKKYLDVNVNKVFQRSRDTSRKKIRDDTTDSGGSWVTIESTSSEEELVSSSEEVSEGQKAKQRGRSKSYSNDDLEQGGGGHGSEVRTGSRFVYFVFFGAIFLTLFVAGLVATFLSLYKTYFE